jgi:hypothetical protein
MENVAMRKKILQEKLCGNLKMCGFNGGLLQIG